MSGLVSSTRQTATRWHVREAEPRDAEAIVEAVSELLVELGATPPSTAAMLVATRTLLDDGNAGALLVAEADDALVGVLTASWQIALHIPGRYGLIQDLWVRPSWRSRAIGAALLAALLERAHDLGIARVEVGLPKDSFARLSATRDFYAANGFAPLGPRMRRTLA